ncbi:MAG: hypothetical protein ACKO0W_12955 [Planctomycetota bacterium]
MQRALRLALAGILATSCSGCASAPEPPQAGVVLSRDAALQRAAWPTHLESIVLFVDGRERTDPLTAIRAGGWVGGPMTIEYRAPDAEPALFVAETSEIAIEGESSRWRRTFVVRGLGSGRELTLIVPAVTPRGEPIAVAVNGAPLVAGFGESEQRVPLARDEATRIELRWRSQGVE